MPESIMGDKLRRKRKRGSDISSQRLDELDSECVRFALDLATPGVAVDPGCGYGAQGFRLGSLGMSVWMFDLEDISRKVKSFNRSLGLKVPVTFCQKDIRHLRAIDLPKR